MKRYEIEKLVSLFSDDVSLGRFFIIVIILNRDRHVSSPLIHHLGTGVLANVEPIGKPCFPTVLLSSDIGSDMDSWSGGGILYPEGGTAEVGREGRGVEEFEGGGGISVFNTLVAFRLGFGAFHELVGLAWRDCKIETYHFDSQTCKTVSKA